MNFRTIIITIIYSTLYYLSYGQSAEILDTNQYWTLTDHNSIEWNVITENRLPHGGNIEMSGKRVSISQTGKNIEPTLEEKEIAHMIQLSILAKNQLYQDQLKK